MIFDKDDDPLYQKQKTVIFWSNMVSVSRLRVKTIAPLFSEFWSENKKMIRRKRTNVQVLQNVYDIQSHPCLLHEFHLVLNRFNYLLWTMCKQVLSNGQMHLQYHVSSFVAFLFTFESSTAKLPSKNETKPRRGVFGKRWFKFVYMKLIHPENRLVVATKRGD
jgi:hypothetical protein